MMNQFQISALLVDGDGNPVKNRKVTVQLYELSRNAWTEVASSKTSTSGTLSLKKTVSMDVKQAPLCRLVESGANPARVLVSAPYLNYEPRSQVLLIDFGTIELLEQAAFRVKETASTFREDKTVISGQARHPQILVSNLMLNADTLNVSRANLNTTTRGTVNITDNNASGNANINPAAANISLDEINRLKEVEVNFTERLRVKDADLLVKERQLTESNQTITSLRADLIDLEARERVLKDQNEVFTKEELRLAPIENIASNIGQSLDLANQAMQESSNPYKIQNISLELNGSISQDGKSIALTRLGDLTQGFKGTQSLKLDLVDRRPQRKDQEATVPDVTGLTESMARRILQSVGLSMQSLTRSRASDSKFSAGQAMSQSPAAGEKLPINEKIHVVFATKAPEEDA